MRIIFVFMLLFASIVYSQSIKNKSLNNSPSDLSLSNDSERMRNESGWDHGIPMIEKWSLNNKETGYNIEAFDINSDGIKDLFIGNRNSTDVHLGEEVILDKIVDLTFRGRLAALLDFNGDGLKDLVTLYFSNYRSSNDRYYKGEILFYWGNNTELNSIDTTADYSIPIPYDTNYIELFGFNPRTIKIGNLNDDKYEDIIFYSKEYTTFNPEEIDIGNGLYIYFGNDFPAQNPDYMNLDPNTLPTFLSNMKDYGEYYDIGDVNDDGIDDLLLSYYEIINVKDTVSVLLIYYGSDSTDYNYGNASVRLSSIYKKGVIGEWFSWDFSLGDVDGDDKIDLVVGGNRYRDMIQSNLTTTKFYKFTTGIPDTIPFAVIEDIDSSDSSIYAGGIAQMIGDFNKDGYNDFLLSPAGYKIFSVNLGGKKINKFNPYYLRGILDSDGLAPNKAINAGDQNNDGVDDLLVCDMNYFHTVLLFTGDSLVHTDIKESFNVKEIESLILKQNYPNPFNPNTVITYTLFNDSDVRLIVYNNLGQKITTLVNEKQMKGDHQINFNAGLLNLCSGIYYYELNLGDNVKTRKMMVLK